MTSETIFGVESFWAVCLAASVYFSVGLWLFWNWATGDDQPKRPWRWGDPPRKAKSFEARVLEHIGGVAVFLSICVFGLRILGLG